jgi:AcrR family transcriptional regulator
MARRKTTDVLSSDVEQARLQILGAAEKVFLRYGVTKSTMDDIARESGVSRPTIYRYFADREALVAAMVEMRARMLFDRAREFIDSQEGFEDQVVEGLAFLVDHGRRDPIVRSLVSPEHMEKAVELVEGSRLGARLMAEMWGPILLAARDTGEVRADVDVDAVGEWFALLQVILVGRQDLVSSADPTHRTLFRNFVVPALRPQSS